VSDPGRSRRRSQRRLSRIAKGPRARCYSPLALARIAKGDGSGLNHIEFLSNAMDDPYDLVLAMFGVAVAAVTLVAGGLYLVTMRPDPPETYPQPPGVITSSIEP
jgi:hypothetical protein